MNNRLADANRPLTKHDGCLAAWQRQLPGSSLLTSPAACRHALHDCRHLASGRTGIRSQGCACWWPFTFFQCCMLHGWIKHSSVLQKKHSEPSKTIRCEIYYHSRSTRHTTLSQEADQHRSPDGTVHYNENKYHKHTLLHLT
jgi:hypothetical protein